ncbi:kinase-like domain-containing protein [Hypoxylon sp. NC1633]|nr:kinase-like domain-containing protein [Hypoxylon sp. NC1633]
MAFWSDEGPELVANRLRLYFDTDPRWAWEGQIGIGANGQVFKLTFEGKPLALKVCGSDVNLSEDEKFEAHMDTSESRSLQNEKHWLTRLRGCRHIIQTMDVPNDPLAQTLTTIQSHMMKCWIYMEYAHNGSLQAFIDRNYSLYQAQPVPNRILWNIFRCLVRACVEMGYYDKTDLSTFQGEAELLNVAPGPLAHNDFTISNVVVGDIDPAYLSPEHDLMPTIKAIDFGEALELDPNRAPMLGSQFKPPTGWQQNIMDVGVIMMYVITGVQESMTRGQFEQDGEVIDTWAGLLLKNMDNLLLVGVSRDLINMVCACVAVNPEQRPGIQLALTLYTHLTALGRPGVHEVNESNDIINERIRRILYDAEI